MKCRKQLVLTGYRVQFVDLREPKPRTPQEQIHVADRQWLDAIKTQYEKGGYMVFSVQPIKPKRVVEIDLCQLWEQTAPAATEDTPATPDSEVCPE